jgi:SAM-dependent methyltransferase
MKIKALFVNNLQFLMKKLPFDYKKYWDNQYKKYGMNITYLGFNGMPHEIVDYEFVFGNLDKIIKRFNIGKNANILDVGCGIGIYADYFNRNGFESYSGIDIVKDMVDKLNSRYKRYTFFLKDFTKEKIKGKYDLILVLSVTQHIVLDKDFEFAMRNAEDALTNSGLLLITDYLNLNKREAINQRWRGLDYYRHILRCSYMTTYDFRKNGDIKKLFVFKK